jgi:ABC-type Fe3+-hydroxamate transport system substrate-binding protein
MTYNYEAIADFEPDVILHEFGIASYYDVDTAAETLADHPVGSGLTAVEEDRVYPSANPVQGPVMNLFQLEMTAKQLYPNWFGEWPDNANGDLYPEIPVDE